MKSPKTFLIQSLIVAVAFSLAPATSMAQPVAGASSAERGVFEPPVAPPGSSILYDQTSNISPNAWTSQNFAPVDDAYDSQLADDFSVASAAGWDVTQVNVIGIDLFDGITPTANVWIYDDNAGQPGAPVCSHLAVAANDNGIGDLFLALPAVCELSGPATYWVSVQANLDISVGQWYWFDRTPGAGNPAQWENPGDGFGTGCTSWSALTGCLANSTDALAFAVAGRENIDTARFAVTKDFTDGNPSEVNVTLSCSTGLPIIQSQMISEAQDVVFIVESYADEEMNCDVTEEEVFGYEVQYYDGVSYNDTGCEFDNVPFGANYSCEITNEPGYVDVDILKLWFIEGEGGDAVDLRYTLTLYCDAEIAGGSPILYGEGASAGGGPGPFACGGGIPTREAGIGPVIFAEWCKSFNGNGPDNFIAEVRPEYPDSNCWVLETVYDSSVEVDNGCGWLQVSAGVGDSCEITNSVFFEGIPTLGQYGMAILALLMLGMGFIGFRRFA